MEAQNKAFINGILLKGVLIPKLLNKPFASCSFTNLDFLIQQAEYFDCITNLFFFIIIIFCSNYFWVNIFYIFSTLHAISPHLIFITLIINLFFVLKILIY